MVFIECRGIVVLEKDRVFVGCGLFVKRIINLGMEGGEFLIIFVVVLRVLFILWFLFMDDMWFINDLNVCVFL